MLASLTALILLVLAPFAGPSAPPATHLPTAPLEIGEIEANLIVRYADSVALQEAVSYVQAVVADEEAQAAAAALRTAQETAQAKPVTAPQPAYSSPAPVPQPTGACGGATNGADRFIQRESGGNPSAYNPSGAWGCYQIMPGTWAGAGCNDLGAYGSASPAAQAACASRLDLSAWNL